MRARLFNNGAEISTNPFVGRFVGAVCACITSCLKAPRPQKSIALALNGDRIELEVDCTPVALDKNQGFAGTLVRDTIQGMIRNLKGVDPRAAVKIIVNIEEEPWPN